MQLFVGLVPRTFCRHKRKIKKEHSEDKRILQTFAPISSQRHKSFVPITFSMLKICDKKVAVCVNKRHKNAIFGSSRFQKFNFDCLVHKLLNGSPKTENIFNFVCRLWTKSSIMISRTQINCTLAFGLKSVKCFDNVISYGIAHLRNFIIMLKIIEENLK